MEKEVQTRFELLANQIQSAAVGQFAVLQQHTDKILKTVSDKKKAEGVRKEIDKIIKNADEDMKKVLKNNITKLGNNPQVIVKTIESSLNKIAQETYGIVEKANEDVVKELKTVSKGDDIDKLAQCMDKNMGVIIEHAEKLDVDKLLKELESKR